MEVSAFIRNMEYDFGSIAADGGWPIPGPIRRRRALWL